MIAPLLMAEQVWRDSQLSVARLFGSIVYNGQSYIIVDKHGRDLYECSEIAERVRRDMIKGSNPPHEIIESVTIEDIP